MEQNWISIATLTTELAKLQEENQRLISRDKQLEGIEKAAREVTGFKDNTFAIQRLFEMIRHQLDTSNRFAKDVRTLIEVATGFKLVVTGEVFNPSKGERLSSNSQEQGAVLDFLRLRLPEIIKNGRLSDVTDDRFREKRQFVAHLLKDADLLKADALTLIAALVNAYQAADEEADELEAELDAFGDRVYNSFTAALTTFIDTMGGEFEDLGDVIDAEVVEGEDTDIDELDPYGDGDFEDTYL